MTRSLSWCFAAVILATPAAAQRKASVQQLSWLAGCWRQTAGARVVDEQWMTPRAGVMLGMSRTVRDDTLLVEYEQLRIADQAGGAVYHAEPSGQPSSDFTAAGVSDTMVTFANPAHDFPQRIIYRKRGADSLIARIEGTRGGQTRGIDFPYVRVACPR